MRNLMLLFCLLAVATTTPCLARTPKPKLVQTSYAQNTPNKKGFSWSMLARSAGSSIIGVALVFAGTRLTGFLEEKGLKKGATEVGILMYVVVSTLCLYLIFETFGSKPDIVENKQTSSASWW